MSPPSPADFGGAAWTVRPATADDATALAQLFAAVATAGPLGQVPAEVANHLIAAQHQARTAQYAAAYPEATDTVIVLVGPVLVGPVPGVVLAGPVPAGPVIGRILVDRGYDRWHLVDIAIVPEWQRHGIGSALLDQLCNEADRAEVAIGLSVASDNPARAWYRSHGFEERSDDGVYVTAIRPRTGASESFTAR